MEVRSDASSPGDAERAGSGGKAVSFGVDRSVSSGVYVDSAGVVLGEGVVEKESCSGRSGASAVSAAKSGVSALRKRAPGQLSIQSALSKREKF